jgi:hypothetical protein
MRRYLRLAFVIAAAGTAIASLSLPANAASSGNPTGPSQQDPVIQAFIAGKGWAFINNQSALQDFTSWILTRPGIGSSGYVESIDDAATKSVTIRWYGQPTALEQAILAEGARRGIAVTMQPWKYSLAQIESASSQVFKEAAAGAWPGFKVVAVVGDAPGVDGLQVQGEYTTSSVGIRAQTTKLMNTSIADGMPLTISPGHDVRLADGSRDTDFAPFNAGGMMQGNSGGSWCSSGFAIAINGVTHTTTARHCTDYPYVSADPPNNSYGTSIGTSGDGAERTLSSSGSALAFDGAWNSVNFVKSVFDFGDLSVGNFICTGGGNSGEHCSIQVTNLLVTINDPFGSFASIEAHQTRSGAIAAMEGDSGGPVISIHGTSEVYADGMIQAIRNDNPANCGGAFIPAQCSQWVYFTSTRTIARSISGATLVTDRGLIGP